VVGGGPFCDAVLPATAGGIHRGRKKKESQGEKEDSSFSRVKPARGQFD